MLKQVTILTLLEIKYILNQKKTARYIPSVSRSREQDLLNAAFDNIKQKREYLSDVANERNRVLESVNDYAHRVRAEKADQMFGTNYSDTYKLLSDLYEHKFFSLPEVQGIDMKEIGKMQAKDQANKNFIKTGIGAGPEDFDFLVNPYRPMAADELARHELNHYTDFIISRNRDTSTNNNMLKQLEASLKKTNDVKDDYFKLGTEQKAYMNQLRTRMYNDKAISSLEEPVSTALIQFAILDKWEQNSYFTNDEKDFIINYLIDCLVENQPFDCSSLGPNKYLNE